MFLCGSSPFLRSPVKTPSSGSSAVGGGAEVCSSPDLASAVGSCESRCPGRDPPSAAVQNSSWIARLARAAEDPCSGHGSAPRLLLGRAAVAATGGRRVQRRCSRELRCAVRSALACPEPQVRRVEQEYLAVSTVGSWAGLVPHLTGRSQAGCVIFAYADSEPGKRFLFLPVCNLQQQ